MNKPITVLHYEFLKNLAELIKESELPYFIVEQVLRDTESDISKFAQKQLEHDIALYNAQNAREDKTDI